MSTEPDRITAVTHDTAHVAEALALFYRQFHSAAMLRALAAPWFAQVQQLEDALWALYNETLDTAVGAGLDTLGALLGFGRGVLGDDAMRAVLRAVVAANRSSGNGDELIDVALLALGVGATVAYREGGASVLITPGAPIPFDPNALLTVLKLAKDGGVALQLMTPPVASSALFTFSSDPFRAQSSSTQGFADTTQTSGGHLNGVIE